MKRYESREEILEDIIKLKDLIAVVGKTPKLVAKAKRLVNKYKNWNWSDNYEL